MVNMRAGLPRLGTVCDEYGLGGMEHILMMAGSAHELRMVTCPALGGWHDGLFGPPDRHRGWGDGRESPR
jgi:hypothetical protein